MSDEQHSNGTLELHDKLGINIVYKTRRANKNQKIELMGNTRLPSDSLLLHRGALCTIPWNSR